VAKTDFLNMTNVTKMPDNNKIVFSNIKIKLGELCFYFFGSKSLYKNNAIVVFCTSVESENIPRFL